MFPKNCSIEKDSASLSQCAGGELPFIRRKKPGPAENSASFDLAGNNSAFARIKSSFELDRAVFDKIETIRGLALMKDDLTLFKPRPACTIRENFDVLIVHPCKKRSRSDVVCQIVRVHTFVDCG